MQERQVTVGRVRHRLADPFFVLATQNPIEQEGTYPLPEAQQDRFMFKVFVQVPELRRGVRDRPPHDGAGDRRDQPGADRRADPGAAAARPPGAGDRPRHPATRWPWCGRRASASRACRSSSATGCRWGAGPRAVQYLILGGKARALLYGRVARADRGHPGAGLAGAAAPHPDELHRRLRRHHHRHGRREADRGDARTRRAN